MAASAATRNASRSFRSMAGRGLATELDACRKLPPQDFSPKVLTLASNSEANFAGKKAGQVRQDKIGYFTRPIQGKLPFRNASRSGELATSKQFLR
jgi:hypothetical protein